MDTSACNYDTSAEVDDGSCIYAADGYDCAGECLSGVLLVLTDSWGDGWNGAVLTINGVDYEVSSGSSSSACVEYLDCNTMSWTPGSYDVETSWTWGTESGSGGNHPSSPVGDNCDSVLGCTDHHAPNYDPWATVDDGSCDEYCQLHIDYGTSCDDYAASGFTCDTLSTEYGFDCTGCTCPNDVGPSCDDFCLEGYSVVDGICTVCPDGQVHHGGDCPEDGDTSCGACFVDEVVLDWSDGTHETSYANFGHQIITPVTAPVVLSDPLDGCGEEVTVDATGSFLLVQRGTCTFVEKALNGQNAGALAVLIYNNVVGGPMDMVGQDEGAITIPVISLAMDHGEAIAAILEAGSEDVSATIGCYEPLTCSDDQILVMAGGGTWDSEISWQIFDCEQNELGSGVAGEFCVNLGGEEYWVNLIDSWGDGWNGAVMTVDGVFIGEVEDGDSTYIGDCAPEPPVFPSCDQVPAAMPGLCASTAGPCFDETGCSNYDWNTGSWGGGYEACSQECSVCFPTSACNDAESYFEDYVEPPDCDTYINTNCYFEGNQQCIEEGHMQNCETMEALVYAFDEHTTCLGEYSHQQFLDSFQPVCDGTNAAMEPDGWYAIDPSCAWAALCDCNDVDADGVCDDDGMVAQGCMDTSACNYDTSAEVDDGSCIYAADGYDCAGECLSGVLLVLTDSWGDGWNGAVLTINGVDYEVSSGSSSSACVEYLDCNTMSWTPGSYDGETSWTWGTESGSDGNHPDSPVGDNCDSDCNDVDADGVCDDVDNCVGALDECGICNGNGIAAGACDCTGNVVDECGVCGGDGIAAGACDCTGNVVDECGICNGDGTTCAEVVLVESTVSFPDALTPVQENNLRDEYCTATAVASGISVQYVTCSCERITRRRRLLNVEYLLSASVSQTVLTDYNIIDVESMQNGLQSAIVIDDVVAATSSIETVYCDTDGTCAPAAAVQSTSESGGGGSSAGIIIVVLLLLLGGGGAGYYFYTQQKPDNDIEMMEADAGDDAV